MNYWKILRILTTNNCNYRCLYCHNEGQEKEQRQEALTFSNFLKIMDSIEKTDFQEIRFSGGEPLVNSETVKMIEWLNDNTEYEIGLATNGSLITDNIAQRLGATRTLVTIHFPSTKDEEYMKVTGMHNDAFKKCIELLDKNHVTYSFNFVLYPETINNIYDVLGYVVSHGKRIKLLPYIERGFNNYSNQIIEEITNRLNKEDNHSMRYEKQGITVWEYGNGGKIKLIDSPCYEHNMNKCREYGELRLLPGMYLQSCIFDDNPIFIGDMSAETIRNTMADLWEKFTECI